MLTTAVKTRILAGFDDPTFGPEQWEELLRRGGRDSVYLTWHWQRAWWDTFGDETGLLLIVAERNEEVIALAPLYTQSRMVYFVGTGFESDCLDFIGDIGDAEVLEAMLETARAQVPEFEGFRFYFVPDASGTGKRLHEAATRLGLSCYSEDEDTAPVLDVAAQPALARAAAVKKNLLKVERFFRRDGTLDVQHFRNGDDILPQLDDFFQQHVARFNDGNPSRFCRPAVRQLIERFTRLAAHTGLLRFTRVTWQGRPIAFHYGFCYRGRFFWGMPSFAIDLARHSPGQVLLRQLLLAAVAEDARVFDFGTGDQAFKLRFATSVNHVRTWGLYTR